MQPYYPSIKPYAVHHLAVEKPHVLYVEEVGSPQGLPVLFVHGGPGCGCSEDARRFFDPEKYRIILFDQRGCGRSKPHAELTHNNTAALISDIEFIRRYLNISQWVVFGGSWGSTLSLAYAQAHPEPVLFLIVRGIFLGTDEELTWLYRDGANRIFPDYWEDFISVIPEDERQHDLIDAFYTRLTGQDEITRMAAAKAWSLWEGRISTLLPSEKMNDLFSDPAMAISMACMETHYFRQACFLEQNQLLKNMHRIAHIPGIIVQGRYDIICPAQAAWQLHKAWAASTLHIVRHSGHAASEAATTDALIHATQEAWFRLK